MRAGNLKARTASYLSPMTGRLRKLWKKSQNGATNHTMKRLKYFFNTLQKESEPVATWPSYPREQAEQSESVLDPAAGHSQGPIPISSDSESNCTQHSRHRRSLAAETGAITFEDVQRIRTIYKRPAVELFRPKNKKTENIKKTEKTKKTTRTTIPQAKSGRHQDLLG